MASMARPSGAGLSSQLLERLRQEDQPGLRSSSRQLSKAQFHKETGGLGYSLACVKCWAHSPVLQEAVFVG